MHDVEEVTNFYQPLFNHMSEQHGLTLLESEMDEIILLIQKMKL
jgi:predicted small metal-binding protein